MHPLLVHDRQNQEALLARVHQAAAHHLTRQELQAPGKRVGPWQAADLPAQGRGAHETLRYFLEQVAPQLNGSAGPRYFGFVTGGATPASVVGDWLVSTFDQNACGHNDSAAPLIEQQTIDFFKQLFGLPSDFFGSFVTGATQSNAVGLALGREWVGEQQGMNISNEGSQHLALHVASGTAHSSVYKAMSFLGMGRHHLISIDTLPHREAVNVARLETYLQSLNGKPVIVVANAGTVNTADFDDLEAIGQLKQTYPFWMHVDAAFGGFAALSPDFRHWMKGIEHADSITIDAHKWLNVPYDAAMQFTRHRGLQLKVFQNSAAYLSDPEQSPDYFHYTPENSRRWRALPSWFTLMAYGQEGHREIVERNCACARQLGDWIAASADYQLLASVRMNIVCFAPRHVSDRAALHAWLARIRDDGRVFFTPTIYKGLPAVRAAFSNWQTSAHDVQMTIDVLNQLLPHNASPTI